MIRYCFKPKKSIINELKNTSTCIFMIENQLNGRFMEN